MFHIFPWWVIVLILLTELAIMAACAVAFALLLNWIFKTPLQRYLVSTGIIAVVVYFVTGTIFLYTLPPLRWVNTVPQDSRTWMWDHLQMLSAAVAFVCVSLWQLLIRMKRKFGAPASA
jgi:hypothetical protein